MSRYRYTELHKLQALGYALEVIGQAIALNNSSYLPQNSVSESVYVSGNHKLKLL